MMTPEQLKYKYNCKRSIQLCKTMELLKTEVATVGDILKPELHQHLTLEINKINDELELIWDEQIDLYNKIHDKEK